MEHVIAAIPTAILAWSMTAVIGYKVTGRFLSVNVMYIPATIATIIMM